MTRLRGLVRRSRDPARFLLVFVDLAPDLAAADLPVNAVIRMMPVGEHPLGPVYDVDVELARPPVLVPLPPVEPVVGAGARYGVPFIIATPHHVAAVRNPASMGGAEPIDVWEGTFGSS